MTTHRNTWKSFERAVASFFGGQRTPLSGGNSKHTRGDVIHDSVYVECKMRQRLATWAVWEDAAEKAALEGKTPVVCLKQKDRKSTRLNSSH